MKGVRFAGRVSEGEKLRLLQAATAIVVASEAEGFGLTILEAGSTATPAVAVDLPVYREVIANRVSGVLVPENDGTALTEGLRYVRDHPELRDGAARTAGRFTWETTAALFAAALEKAVRS
jgi:glycosyltransferase involved in cell wall biosynthesis